MSRAVVSGAHAALTAVDTATAAAELGVLTAELAYPLTTRMLGDGQDVLVELPVSLAGIAAGLTAYSATSTAGQLATDQLAAAWARARARTEAT
jgi:hypothetical protein